MKKKIKLKHFKKKLASLLIRLRDNLIKEKAWYWKIRGLTSSSKKPISMCRLNNILQRQSLSAPLQSLIRLNRTTSAQPSLLKAKNRIPQKLQPKYWMILCIKTTCAHRTMIVSKASVALLTKIQSWKARCRRLTATSKRPSQDTKRDARAGLTFALLPLN